MTEPATHIGSIAIVGMAGRFPGAPNLETFWRNLRDGVESITFFTDAELQAAGVDPALLKAPNYVRARSLISDAASFDAAFWGFTPREAESMDPQQRVFLETAWEALENSGYDSEQYAGSIGVFAGLYMNTYLLSNVVTDRAFIASLLSFKHPGAFQTFLGNDKDYLTSRVAFKMNLRGPGVTVQTACSTSLVAVCQACQSLLSYGCDMALAGGITLTFPEIKGYLHEEGGMLSPDGHCRAFDAKAAGTVFGNGTGVVVLKRLEDALNDGDTIHAVIRGSAINNDGSQKVSYAAPSVDGQTEVISLAQAVAGISADTITYVEAHGTGTPLGDPIEVAALTQAFRETTQRKGFCALGTVKTNIGHLDVAAGVAGLIKTTLALQHRQIPPSLHFQSGNPQIDFAKSPFYVASKLQDWTPPSGTPRRAGVSSFGVGGTNAHVVLEEAPDPAPASPSARPQLLVLSAKSEAALQKSADRLREHLQAHPELSLADIAHTLRVGRRSFAHRQIIVARDIADAVAQLGSNPTSGAATNLTDREIVFLFPGQGAQQPGMGRALYETEPVFRRELDRCSELFRNHLGRDLREILYAPDGSENTAHAAEQLKETRYAQPALFAVEWALAQLWLSWNIRPQAMIGHSIGEYVAACLAEVMTLEDAIGLVAKRAQLTNEQPRGLMMAVRLAESELQARLPSSLSLAAINSPKLCVVAGAEDAITVFEEQLANEGIATVRLQTSHAFHSAMMEPVVEPFTACFQPVSLRPPKIPFVSCTTGKWIGDHEATSATYWARHLREPVRFAQALDTLCQSKETILLEVGPGTTLTTLARQNPVAGNRPVVASQVNDTAAAIHRCAGQLWLAGAKMDWTAYVFPEKRRRIPLPTYPFERTKYWIEPPAEFSRAVSEIVPKEMESAVVTSSETASTTSPRRERLLAEISAMLFDMSGIVIGAREAQATFVELGFDSLFLTQARQAFLAKFGVKISFRQLLEEVTTPNALADYFDWQMATETPETHPPAVPPIAASNTPPKPKPFGPFRPVQNFTHGGLTPRQETHLREFVRRFNTRTAKSKQYTQEAREGLADPRSVAGYRQLWKEIVYQIVADKAHGQRLWDIDGNAYIDITMGFGVHFLGHSPKCVTSAIHDQLQASLAIGPQSPLIREVADLFRELTGTERVTFCNTGSEAVMAAMRIARAVTGRTKIVFFTGDYHGMFDEVLLRANNAGGRLRSLPIAPGIPANAGNEIYLLEYGTPESLEIIKSIGHELAAVLVEPVESRHPDLVPIQFLKDLRAITQAAGTKLIFDEVITGFRMHPGGCQALFDIQADLVTYGKVLGGGIPIGVVAGKAECLDAIDGGPWQFGDDSAPEAGMTFFAGTFVRHPMALAAARAVLLHLKSEGPALQERVNALTKILADRANAFFDEARVPIRILHFGSLFRFAISADNPHANLFFSHLLDRGIYIREASQNCFLSTEHTAADVEAILSAIRSSVHELQEAGFLPRQSGITGAVPLTEGQKEIWLATQLGPSASCAYNESFSLRFRGSLDIDRIRWAVNQVIARHEALRMTFLPDGSAQHPAEQLSIDIPLHDWANHDDAESLLREHLAQDATKPFDLVNGPLIRATLVRLAREEHSLMVTTHHLICDGWSSNVIIENLRALYDSYPNTGDLEEPTPFSEYVRWEEEVERNMEGKAAAEFWQSMHRQPAVPVDLPSDFARPALRSFRGARISAHWDAAFTAKLKTFCAEQNATLFTTLFATFATLIHRLSGQNDLVIGIPAAGQNAMGRQELAGHCANVLPLRLAIDSTRSYREFLATAKPAILDAFEHQTFTFGQLLQTLDVVRDPARPPLVSVTFNFDPPVPAPAFPGLEVSVVPNARHHYQFELSFNIVADGSETRIECDYNSDLFSAESIERWLGHYRTLLDGVLQSIDQPIGKIPLITAEEREKLVALGRGARTDYDAGKTVDAIFSECASRASSNAIAIIDGDTRLRYAELDAVANQIAHSLRERKVSAGQLVGLSAERSWRFIAAILGILKAGAAYVPLDQREAPSRLEKMRAGCDHFLDLHGDFASQPNTTPAQSATSQGVACVLYTSGSTGLPRGVMVPHEGIARLVRGSDYVVFRPDDIVSLASNVCFDGVTFEIWGALLNGGTLVITPQEVVLSPSLLKSHLETHRITTLFLTTSLFNQIVQHTPELFRNLRNVVFGGEAADAHSVRLVLENGRPERLVNGYGPTEATTFSVCHIVESANGARIPIGRPIANTDVLILDPNLQPVSQGVAGELYIGGVGVALGYFQQPELTADRFLETPFGRLYRTGDLVCWLPDGTIDYLGRVDQQIKLRGFRIEPAEIEAALREHPAVDQCIVTLRETAPGDHRLIAYYSHRNGRRPTPEEFTLQLARRVPSYMVPSAFLPVDSFPLTPNGKLDIAALPLPDGKSFTLNGYVPPAHSVHKQLVEIWEGLLGVHPIGIRHDFFELGGHSLLAAKMLTLIEERIGKRIGFQALFEHPTIEHLAELLLDEQQQELNEAPFAAIHQEGSQRPFFFLHGDFFGGGFYCKNLARHLDTDRPFYALHPHGLRGEETPNSIEAMAASRLADIRKVQPNGPYLIGGYCNGALVAYEIARLLAAEGEQADALIMLAADGSNISFRPAKSLCEVISQVLGETPDEAHKRFLGWSHRLTLTRALFHYYKRAFFDLTKQPFTEQIRRLKRKGRRVMRHLGWNLPERKTVQDKQPAVPEDSRAAMASAYDEVWDSYVPGRYRGPIKLLWPKNDPPPFSDDPAHGWTKICPNVELILVPGEHHSCIVLDDHLHTIAREMRCILDAVDHRQSKIPATSVVA